MAIVNKIFGIKTDSLAKKKHQVRVGLAYLYAQLSDTEYFAREALPKL